MSFTIVYKTYQNDLLWINYSLQSINKFVYDIDEIIIYYHNECKANLEQLLSIIQLKFPLRIIPVIYDFHGYVKQMVVKSMCFQDVKTDYVVFVDSDVIFDKPYTPKIKLINTEINTEIQNQIEIKTQQENKIIWNIINKTETNKNDCQWSVWEKSVENMTQKPMNIYYMANGFPFVMKTITLHDAYYKFIEIHNMDYNQFCKIHLDANNVKVYQSIFNVFTTCAKIFEEFEYLGWYAHNFTNDYIFTDDQSKNTNNYKQYWSHGGITSQISSEINSILQI